MFTYSQKLIIVLFASFDVKCAISMYCCDSDTLLYGKMDIGPKSNSSAYQLVFINLHSQNKLINDLK